MHPREERDRCISVTRQRHIWIATSGFFRRLHLVAYLEAPTINCLAGQFSLSSTTSLSMINMLSVLLTVVLLCGQVAVVDSACSCVGCTDRESVPAYSTESWSATGTHVEVSVRSTDGSALKVRTCSKADCSRIWGDASADGTVTCFNSGPVRVSTTPTYIRVEVECENWIQSCPIQYDVLLLVHCTYQYACSAFTFD